VSLHWRCGTGWGVAIKLHYFVPLLVIGSSLITDGWAQSKSTSKRSPTPVLMKAQAAGTISLSLGNAPDGVPLKGGNASQRSLDLGTVSYQNGASTLNVGVQKLAASFVVSTKFGMTVQDSTGNLGTATVLAAMAAPDVFIFRVDGLRLGTVPQLIQAQAKPGVTGLHLLEIEVPSSLTEKNSQLQNSILFQVIAN
jgi:hypothetical protein